MITSFTERYKFLSNFYPCKIQHDGIEYPSVEHAYQASKTFDRDKRKEIASLSTAGKAKKAGQSVSIRPDWEKVKDEIMWQLLQEKFRDGYIRGLLLQTGDKEIIEGNTWGDTYWGCVWSLANKEWEGQNKLGKLHMGFRRYFSNQMQL